MKATTQPAVPALRLAGRVAIVTGAARGIGAATVERLALEGAAVVFSYLTRHAEAIVLERRLSDQGLSVVAIRADVASATDCAALIADAVARFGRIDILVNNAAETDAHRAWDTITDVDWDHVMAVNARGPFLCFRACFEHLRASSAGRVINLGSVTFRTGQAGLLHYVASKGAVVGFTRALAREVGPLGITVNAVEPGAIRTEQEVEKTLGDDESVAQALAQKQAIPRRGVASDVASAVVFFASDDAAFITGQCLLVDGGWALS